MWIKKSIWLVRVAFAVCWYLPLYVYAETSETDVSPSDDMAQPITDNSVKRGAYDVRVLLADEPCADNIVSWAIQAEHGFFLADSCKGPHRMSSSKKELVVSYQNGSCYLNNKKILKQKIVIKPQGGHLNFLGTSYQGCFVVQTDGERCYLTNVLEMEDYVCSVVKSEGWPGWPHEMNKVLAITCRTYVISMIKEARETKRVYDIKNTNAHQTYKGVHAHKHLKKAVDDTRGVFLSYENKPILAMFDICCGGVIPAGIHGFDFERAPYLARSYACTYCKDCSSYSWNMSLEKREFITYLQKEFPQLTAVRDVKISKKDKAGLVMEAVVKGARSAVTISGRKLYKLFKNIRSYCFGVYKKGNTITFKGRGFGHHLGLCQWGARAMVRDGWDYMSILSFYYPQTRLMRLV